MIEGRRRVVIVIGALVGAILGPLGVWLRASSHLPAILSRNTLRVTVPGSAPATDSHWWLPLVFIVPAVATGLLMPAFLRRLERNAGRSDGTFYLRSAEFGVVFGFVVTALMTWVLVMAALWIGTFSSMPTESASTVAGALALGTFVYAPIFALSTPFFFLPFVVAAGIPFGLAFGHIVRRWLIPR